MTLSTRQCSNGTIQRRPYPSPDLFNAVESHPAEFRCIVADPPWVLPIGSTVTPSSVGQPWGAKERAPLLYKQMSLDELSSLKFPVEKDAHLYLWTINRYIEQSYFLARSWGFEPSTMLYWIKQPIGMGLGGAFVPCVEPILFARRGKLPVKRRCDRNWWGWPRGAHSQKPEEFQTIVESVSPGPYLELFARRKRPGWSCWGNEIESDIHLTNPTLKV